MVGIGKPAPPMVRRRAMAVSDIPAYGTTFALISDNPERSNRMGMEDQAAGAVKQVKGKANDVIGAAKGDVGQQLKGKAQQVAGKVQSAVGKATSGDSDKK